MSGDFHIQRVVTSGVLGAGRPGYPPGGIPLENNVFVVGDDSSALIIDAAHDAEAIARTVGERDPLGILLTHGHEDHVNDAIALADRLDTHIYLHPADLFLWAETHGTDRLPDFELADRAVFSIAGVELVTLHTPGHTPGSVSFYAGGIGTLFSGDTLFEGGPGATRWEYSDFPQIIDSINTQLLTLPAVTTVLPGHGSATTIGAEAPQIAAWLERGW